MRAPKQGLLWCTYGMDSDDSDDEGAPVLMTVAPHAIRLQSIFDDCLLGELALDSRWCYSTDRMEAVLRKQGWKAEEARQRVARMAVIGVRGWPNLLD